MKNLTAKNFKNLFSKKDIRLLREQLENKDHLRTLENDDLQTKLYVLKQEYRKRFKELVLYYQTELNKIILQHNLKIKQINLK
jgi:hypothetical protein